MSWIIDKRGPMVKMLVLVHLMIFCWAGSSWSQENMKAFAIKPIEPPPQFNPYELDAPEGLLRYGEIGDMSADGMVIDDFFYKFSSSVVFLSGDKKPVSSRSFRRRMKVAFRLNENLEIIAMWVDNGERPVLPGN
jgi:hypothetical protein